MFHNLIITCEDNGVIKIANQDGKLIQTVVPPTFRDDEDTRIICLASNDHFLVSSIKEDIHIWSINSEGIKYLYSLNGYAGANSLWVDQKRLVISGFFHQSLTLFHFDSNYYMENSHRKSKK